MISILRNTNNTRPVFIHGQVSRLFRSDRLTACDEEDIKYLIDHNIVCVIDLRNLEGKEFNALLLSEKIDFNNVPLKYSAKEFENESEENERSMAHYYMYFVKQYDKIKQVFDIILNSKSNILVNCAFGRDRTGTIVALAQMLCGCSDDEIIENYALTDKIFCDLKLEGLFKIKKYINYELAKETMKNFINLFLVEYESVNEYFSNLGYSSEEIKLLKSVIIS